MKLSIGMMVKNEEANLERCLSSLRPLMEAVPSELIVVDTGSTDRTVAIAKGYTDKVYSHPWENDYAKIRNFTVNYANGDWFFFIDADEELVEYAAIVDFLMGKASKRYHAATVQIKSFYETRNDERFSIMSAMRLFRKTKTFRFEGAIHEQPQFELPFCMLEAMLNHYGYIGDDPALKERKLQQYESILLQALEENPLDIHYWHQLSRTYASYKDTKSALQPAVKAYEIMKEQKRNPEDYLYVYSNLSHLYLMNGKPEQSVEIAKAGIEMKDWLVDLWFYMAKAQMTMKQTEEAIQSYQKYLSHLDRYDQNSKQDIRIFSYTLNGREEAYFDLFVLYTGSGQTVKALEALHEIKSADLLQKAVVYCVTLALDLQNYDLLGEFYEKIKALDDLRLRTHFYRTLVEALLRYASEREAAARIFQKEETDYGILNRVRLLGGSEIIDAGILEAVGTLSLDELDSYYGDLFYFILKGKRPLDLIDLHIYEENLELFFQYLDVKYSDLSAVYCEYLQAYPSEYSQEELRVIKIMERNLLLADSLGDRQYEWVLNRYLEDGIAYVRQIYHENILTGKAHLLKSREDAFLMYMGLARELEVSDQAAYVRTLKLSLQAYPEMKKGVELLSERIAAQMGGEKQEAVSELEAYAQIVRKNLRQLIDQKMFQEAREIILSFDEILPNDPDIGRMKAELDAKGVKV